MSQTNYGTFSNLMPEQNVDLLRPIERSKRITVVFLLEIACLIAIFFPYVGVLDGFDVQPFAFLFMVVLFFCAPLISKSVKTNIRVVISLFTIIGCCVIAFFFDVSQINTFYMLRFLVAVLTPYLLFTLMATRNWYASSKTYYLLVITYCLVAFVQIFVDPLFLSFLVSRTTAQVELLVESGRGVRSLTGEPSDFGLVLLMLGVLGWMSKTKEMLSVGRDFSAANLWLLFTLLMNTLFSQSFYSIVMHVIVVFFLVLATKPKWLIPLSIGFFSVAIVFAYYIEFGRISRIISALLNDMDWILAQGAMRRVLNSINSIVLGIQYFPFGYGNRSEPILVNYSIFGHSYTYVSSGILFGGVVEYFYKFGVFSTPFFVCYFYVVMRIWLSVVTLHTKKYHIGIPLAVTAFILTFPAGSIANPLTWFTFFSIYLFCTNFLSVSRSRTFSNIL